jgi:outer membrane lipoprotein SlyB
MLGILVRLAISLCACAPNVSPDSYSVGAVGQVNRVVRGSIISARPVQVSGTQSGVGAGAGAVGGAVAGSAIGSGTRSNVLGALGGAVAGGVAGALIEEGASRQGAFEYVIQTENGALITVVQGGAPLSTNQRVLVIYKAQAGVIEDTTTRQ